MDARHSYAGYKIRLSEMPKIRCHRCTVVELWKLYRKSKSQLCSFIRVMELKITPRHDPTINRGLESDFSNQFVFCASLVENRNTALSLGQQDNCVGDICPAIDFLIDKAQPEFCHQRHANIQFARKTINARRYQALSPRFVR